MPPASRATYAGSIPERDERKTPRAYRGDMKRVLVALVAGVVSFTGVAPAPAWHMQIPSQ